ncbi:hypothetical protein SDC9_157164 [bioreactor metagenome]|uniref:Uncharacterized protein n=1 Tax=bioreactor metagenome TaxID=1076179 RepID=A0A645F6H9_9ZZZZ
MGQCFVDDIEGKNYVFVDFNILALGYLFKYITYGIWTVALVFPTNP